ncbi:hypothetical protein BV898_06466 [Hypsibius exemplaris]|uniref:Uncharacterized protein n=1 Tax=Hypsibius exemplaris TaxID=2072580 RepID=A0A1W0WWA0_HYPEX|nr:hypothetical protein BV898_06466 [Hypsibius exemplaris]
MRGGKTCGGSFCPGLAKVVKSQKGFMPRDRAVRGVYLDTRLTRLVWLSFDYHRSRVADAGVDEICSEPDSCNIAVLQVTGLNKGQFYRDLEQWMF